MNEEYIRGINREIIKYLKDIKSSVDNNVPSTAVDDVESKLDSLNEVLTTVSSGISDMKVLLQEISTKLTPTEQP